MSIFETSCPVTLRLPAASRRCGCLSPFATPSPTQSGQFSMQVRGDYGVVTLSAVTVIVTMSAEILVGVSIQRQEPSAQTKSRDDDGAAGLSRPLVPVSPRMPQVRYYDPEKDSIAHNSILRSLSEGEEKGNFMGPNGLLSINHLLLQCQLNRNLQCLLK